ncbi:MAG: DUF4954 domain-containing protein [Bacteroidetes bacterium]|nr:MAG: DUF4954 domain-containing protein [Bacteroidota bacterium]
MNEIKKSRVDALGYQFIPEKYLPKGKDEYWLRNKQNKNGIAYRTLTASEIEVLVRNRNTSDNWNHILVSDAFSPELVQDCKFFGLVRIGKLEPYYLEFHDLRRPVGLYNSTIISSDLGDNVVVDNVNYLSHFVVGNDVMIVNINELTTSNHAKFGNGIIKEGEPESVRIRLEICNENGGRSIIPFDGMLPGDAWLWSRFRDDQLLQDKLREFTEKKFDHFRGYYGQIGDRTVLKDCKIIKDVLIGTDAYLKGANKLKNLTINSSAKEKTQIGEGCELVNGIIGYGCRIFYGVKAVRFILASQSQLKYGARLINSFLGNNSTISCCEVLNSLIFPSHEQHHNNSFLCAALVMGQSNMAAGATIGSNHNSRSPDGELVAGRGFWPGLCVSLKHNSKFASFAILAKGDYPAELNLPIPFSLVSNDIARDELVVMPGYWFMYNMYALARNSKKYGDRDKRSDKTQLLEFDFLAPDSILEIVESLELFRKCTGEAYAKKNPTPRIDDKDWLKIGKSLLEARNSVLDELDIFASGFENSERKARIIKISHAYPIFKELISYYATTRMLYKINANNFRTLDQVQNSIPARLTLSTWINMGGQLVLKSELDKLLNQIHKGRVRDWGQVHNFYAKQATNYADNTFEFSMAALKSVTGLHPKKMTKAQIKSLLNQAIITREWMTKGIYESRAKDYTNPFRQMTYSGPGEMSIVTGALEENSFIKEEIESLKKFRKDVEEVIKKLKL